MSKGNFYQRYRNNKISKKRTEAWRSKINASNSSYSVKDNNPNVNHAYNQTEPNLASTPNPQPKIVKSIQNKTSIKIGKFASALILLSFTCFLFASLSFLSLWYPSKSSKSSVFLFYTLLAIQVMLFIYITSIRSKLNNILKKGLSIITLILTITFIAGSYSQVSINEKVYLTTSLEAKLYRDAKTMLHSLRILESRDNFLNNDITFIANNNIELLKMIDDNASISAYWTDKRKYTSANIENAALLLAKAANNQRLALVQIDNELNQHDPVNIPLANNYEKEARKQYLQAANLIGSEVGKYGISIEDLGDSK
jgi:hypothetical protein